MQPMPTALKQLLSKGDVKAVSSLFHQEHPRSRASGRWSGSVGLGIPRKPSHRLPQAFAAYIITTETRVESNAARKKYTAYKVLVSNGPTQTWVVRRYSDFYQLHLQIGKRFPTKKLPPFPPKRLLGNHFSSQFVLARREQLNQYLAAITSDPEIRCLDMVKGFFSHIALEPTFFDGPSNPTEVPTNGVTPRQRPGGNSGASSAHGVGNNRLSIFSLWRNSSKSAEPSNSRKPPLPPSAIAVVCASQAPTSSPGTPLAHDLTPVRPVPVKPASPDDPMLKRRTFSVYNARRKLGLIKRKDLTKKRRVHLPPVNGIQTTPSPSQSSEAKSTEAPTHSTRTPEGGVVKASRRLSLSSTDDPYDQDELTRDTSNPCFPRDNTTIDDFYLLKVIGKGSYGKVMLARHKNSGKVYAIKVITKKSLQRRPGDIARIMAERNVLARNISHPFLVGLQYAFQTTQKLYFCIDYVNGGELFFHLQRDQRFDERRAQFYVAEITLALEYLHNLNIVYRDLKPENCLLDSKGHIRIVDFGLAKDVSRAADAKTSTFCGTPEYLAPEVLRQEAYGKSVDWYCLGAVLYEMLVGAPPFYSRDSKDMFHGILHGSLEFPDHVSPVARDLIVRLTSRNPLTRLGSGVRGSYHVKAHRFFEGINWKRLYTKEITPPYNPDVAGIFDLKHIDPAFSNEPIPQSLLDEGTISLALREEVDSHIPPSSSVGAGLNFREGLNTSPDRTANGQLPLSFTPTSTKSLSSNAGHISRTTTPQLQPNRLPGLGPGMKHMPSTEFDLEQAMEETEDAFQGFSFVAPGVSDDEESGLYHSSGCKP